MTRWSFYKKPTQTIPFTLRGYKGKIAIFYGPNDDPCRVGFDALPDLPFDINLSRGYPVIHARIEDYRGSGYRIFCGWIQIITSEYLDPQETAHTYVSVDIAPAIEDSDIPFASYGFYPQLFDAPCRNLGSNSELRWIADTFLTTVPVRSRNEEISCLAGFRWGYIENDVPDMKPVLLPLQVTDDKAWNRHLPFLCQQYKHWRFKPGQADKS